MKKRSLRQSIKVGCKCHFIVRRLCLRPNDVVITYTACRNIDKSIVVCHGKDSVGRPQTLNYAPHLTDNMWANVKQMVEGGFNVTMIWDKLIHDVEHEAGPLFTRIVRDALETR